MLRKEIEKRITLSNVNTKACEKSAPPPFFFLSVLCEMFLLIFFFFFSRTVQCKYDYEYVDFLKLEF